MRFPRDTHEMDAMLLEAETRAIAYGIIARVRAFVSRWRDQRENRETPATALRRVKWMLEAIGAEITVIPGANHGDARQRMARYLIAFNSPIGWQSLQILETNESLYAKIENRLDRIAAAINALPGHSPRSEMDDDQDPSETQAQALALLEHALTLRFALSERDEGISPVPVGFTPLAARAVAAVMLSRTEEDWRDAQNFDDFWKCSASEYAAVRPEDLEEGIRRMAGMRGWGMARTLAFSIDWKPTITIAESGLRSIKVNIVSKGHRVWATVPDLLKSETTGRVDYFEDTIHFTDHDLPESMVTSLPGRPLDDVIDHWLTRGGAATIGEPTDGLPKMLNRREASFSIHAGPGPVVILKSDVERARKVDALRHPFRLRTRKDASSS